MAKKKENKTVCTFRLSVGRATAKGMTFKQADFETSQDALAQAGKVLQESSVRQVVINPRHTRVTA